MFANANSFDTRLASQYGRRQSLALTQKRRHVRRWATLPWGCRLRPSAAFGPVSLCTVRKLEAVDPALLAIPLFVHSPDQLFLVLAVSRGRARSLLGRKCKSWESRLTSARTADLSLTMSIDLICGVASSFINFDLVVEGAIRKAWLKSVLLLDMLHRDPSSDSDVAASAAVDFVGGLPGHEICSTLCNQLSE